MNSFFKSKTLYQLLEKRTIYNIEINPPEDKILKEKLNKLEKIKRTFKNKKKNT